MVNVFDWTEAIYSLTAGGALLLFSFQCFRVEKSVIAPATAFSLTWALTLLFLSITPFLGFYYLNNSAILLFFFGAVIFSTTSLLFRHQLARFGGLSRPKTGIDSINFNALINVYNLLGLVIFPILILDILSYGSNIAGISYNIRMLSVEGEDIASPFVKNYLSFGFFSSILFVYALLKDKLSRIHVALSLLPLMAGSLVLSGRSGLVTLVLSWFFVYVLVKKKVNPRALAWISGILLAVLYLGAVSVSKIDTVDKGFFEVLFLFFEHIAGYLFQGPILFSQYFDGSINIKENWDTLNSMCHLLSKIDLCQPLPQHQDVAAYGNGRFGNVYTFYFSTYPHYSYIGTVVFLTFYSVIITFFYEKAILGSTYSLVVSSWMFSAIVLTVFKDGIGYSFYELIKFFVFYLFVFVFFTGKFCLRPFLKNWT